LFSSNLVLVKKTGIWHFKFHLNSVYCNGTTLQISIISRYIETVECVDLQSVLFFKNMPSCIYNENWQCIVIITNLLD